MNSDFSLKGSKILVTAGSTWIAIDSVRIITNIFKGKIGLTIAQIASQLGADVTLFLGPSLDVSTIELPPTLSIKRFKYFDELDELVRITLKGQKFDAIIHSAAVSDFMMDKQVIGKIKSDVQNLSLNLIPTRKIIDEIRHLAPKAYLVKFKLEVGISVDNLIDIAFASLNKSNADLIVANIYDPQFHDHEAYIIDKDRNVKNIKGKIDIATEILRHVI
ncbi:MAG: phosphopantothenoylcysteine decarboxylase [Candidatus Paceibacterota bacterium]|jgi:phosphopantothenoylcysteine synthetase/decarboxylase